MSKGKERERKKTKKEMPAHARIQWVQLFLKDYCNPRDSMSKLAESSVALILISKITATNVIDNMAPRKQLFQ